MRLLNQKGLANAETLPTFTHYDSLVPAADLETALRIEAERLRSLKIEAKEIRQEAPRCYQEADFVERNPEADMLKHAFMALNQAWRYGRTRAQVRGGLEQIPLADLQRFHRTFYQLKNLVLVLVGGFQPDQAQRWVEKHLGSLPADRRTPAQLPAWGKLPKQRTVQWDSSVRAVCIGFAPPDTERERRLLSMWGTLLLEQLMTDREVHQAADAVMCTNVQWSVGTLPFFVYGTAKAKGGIPALQSLLESRLQRLLAHEPSTADLTQLRAMAASSANRRL